MKKFLFVLIAVALVGCFTQSAYAYTITHYDYARCSGGTALTAQTQGANGCVAYCASLSASCCTTREDNYGSSYLCTPFTNTSAVVSQNDTCSGNPDTCVNRHFMADVISYTTQVDLTAGGITPSFATAEISVTLNANISNIGGATSGAGFTSLFQRATDASGSNATDIGTHGTPALGASTNTTASISYTFPTAGTWYVRACADKSSASNTGTITEFSEANNCGSWTAITVFANLPDLSAGAAGPTAASVGVPVTLFSLITNGGLASTGSGFTNLFQRATSAAGANATDIGIHSASTLASNGNTNATLSYAFPSVGTWYIRACADKSSGASTGTITESNEANNCGSWTLVTVSNPPPTATISASPTVIYAGQFTTLTWSSTNAGSCIGTNFNTYNATSGVQSVSPATPTSFMITCDGVSSSVYVDASSGPPNTGTYSASQITSQGGGNVCGTDVNGGAGTSVAGGFYAAGSLEGYNSNTFPPNFFNYPERFCFEETETWINLCQGCGGDTVNNYGWYVYNSTYVSNPSLPVMYPTGYTGKNNQRHNFSFSAIPAPTASLSLSPSSIIQGASTTLTWSSTNATSCTGTNFSTGGATASSTTLTPTLTTAYSVTCTGPGGVATSPTSTVTVIAPTVDLGAGTPALASGSLVGSTSVTFSASVTNSGNTNTATTFSNRFQIDLNANGSYDIMVDAPNSTVGLNAAQTKTVTSPSWTAVLGTHRIRMCADSPTSVVAETNEGNNCGADYTFTVVNTLTASCSASPTSTGTGQTVTWTAVPSGGTGSYTYAWSGTDSLTGTATSTTKSYATTGTKTGSVTVSSGTQSAGPISCTSSVSVVPLPTASLSASPTTIVTGNSSTLTWNSTAATSCTGTNFSTAGAVSGSAAVSPTATTTYSVSCVNGAGSASANATVNVSAGTIDFTAGVPSLNTGSLAASTTVAFRANVTNGGTGSTSSTFSNRFQIDLKNNSGSSWDVTLTATNSITALSSGQTKQAVSPNWEAVVGTHEIRMCADTPGTVAESNESNNCGPSWIFTVAAPPNAPSITGPTTGYTNTSYMFSFQAIDPATSTIRYGVDWDNNNVVDEYLPASGYLASGLYADAYRTWTTTGAKTFKALTQNSLGASSGWTSHTITLSTAPPPPPVALVTITPESLSGGGSVTITWSSSNATSCTGTGFSTEGATGGVVTVGPFYATQTFSVSCTGPSGTDIDSVTLTVTSIPDLTAGIPGLNSGSLYDGGAVTFWANVTNGGDGATSATFSNRFQVDLNANGSWDVNLDATNSVTGLAVGQTKQAVSPSWSAIEGTHRVRLCADAPASSVAESDESNNCSTSVMTVTVTAAPECTDGIDNNGNGAIDYPADLACTDGLDGTEEVLPSALLSLAATPAGSLTVEGLITEGSEAELAWAATDIIADSCTLTGSNGDSWTLIGATGTVLSSPLTAFTMFTLTCLDLNNAPVSLTASVRITPSYEEL